MSKIPQYMLAGAVATIPMTIVMSRLFERLPLYEKYPAPPRIISMKVAEDAGVKKYMDELDKFEFTMINHFGFGAFAGAGYLPLSKNLPLNKLISGSLYGLAVWGLSYTQVLPSLKLYPEVKDEPVERTGMMIVSHLVWGCSLGLISHYLEKKKLT